MHEARALGKDAPHDENDTELDAEKHHGVAQAEGQHGAILEGEDGAAGGRADSDDLDV